MRKDREAIRASALEAYATLGGPAAAEVTGLSVDTLRRWGQESGVTSGYTRANRQTPCPSEAAYIRGCRCDECKRLHREEARSMKVARVEKGRRNPSLIPHGVGGYVNWDCRCGVCRQEWTAYLRERRAAKVG